MFLLLQVRVIVSKKKSPQTLTVVCLFCMFAVLTKYFCLVTLMYLMLIEEATKSHRKVSVSIPGAG